MFKVKLNGNKELTKNKRIVSFSNPSKVYMSIKGNDAKVLVKKGQYVYKGQIVAQTKGMFETVVCSSISGTVLGWQNTISNTGEKIKCIVIENDSLEKEEKIKLKKMNKENFIELLKNSGIVGMGGSGFPTYVKYESDVKTLIINAVECEPYITSDYALFKKNTDFIITSISKIMEINNIEQCFIAIKKNNEDLIKKINTIIKSKKNIFVKEVKNYYPAGFEKSLVKEVTKKTYDKLPSEISVLVNNVSTVFAIGELLEGIPLTNRLVTVISEDKCVNIKVLLGTKIKDILEFLKIEEEECELIIGGPMMGTSLDDSVSITPYINCILLKEKKDFKSVSCLRCGKCNNVCPAGLCPVLIKDNRNNPSMLKKLKANKCIGCGLCSYICPSNLNIREIVKEASKKVI